MAKSIIIENLYKEYRLGVIGHGTLYRDMQSWWANLRGKEDPNTILGHTGKKYSKDHILALGSDCLDSLIKNKLPENIERDFIQYKNKLK